MSPVLRPLRQVFAYTPPPAPRWPVAAKAAAAVAIVLGGAALAGHIELGFLAALGVFPVLYAPTAPVRLRAAVEPTVGLALLASVALGTLTAGHPVWAIGAMTVIAAVASFVCNALLVGPPGAFFVVLVAGVGGMMATRGLPPSEIITMTAAGVVTDVLVGMSDLLAGVHRPERAAVAAAEAALGRYAADPDDAAARDRAGESLHAAWTAVRDGGSAADLVARALALEERFARVTADAAGGWLGLPPHPWGQVEGTDDGDAADPRHRAAEALMSGAGRDRSGTVRDTSLGRPRPQRLLAAALEWPGEKVLTSARTTLAVGAAGLLGVLAGTAHAYWAAATAALVLHQGGTRTAQTHRGIQRFTGTAAGLVVFAVLQTVVRAPWQAAVVVVVLQAVVELLVVRSYALACVAITPLALTIATGGRTGDAHRLVVDRGLDTLIGVVVALAVLWATGWGTAVPFLRAHARHVVDATRLVLLDLERDDVHSPGALEHRRRLYGALLTCDDVARRALVDEPDAVRPYRRMQRSLLDLGYLVLGLCWRPDRPRDPQVYARAREPLDAVRSTPVTAHRPADEIAADVDAVTRALSGAARTAL